MNVEISASAIIAYDPLFTLAGIDLDAVLCYPLAPVSVPLSTSDGSLRKTVKSKLYDAAMSDLEELTYDDLPDETDMNCYFLDLAAAVRTVVGNIGTIRDLAARVMTTIPQQYVYIYIACDAYLKTALKIENVQQEVSASDMFSEVQT